VGNENSKLRRVIRSILSESRYQKNRNGSFTFQFEVYGPEDETYQVTATYDPRQPFEVEVWKAHGPDGEEIDPVELQTIVRANLEDEAFDWISQNLDSSS
jgi:hypothetical protein